MGVPILFSWLNQKHSECIKKQPPETCDNLYIDLNALIHNCYNANLHTAGEIHHDMICRLENAIDNVVEKTRPTKILYIAVDGVAPAAKLAHQRARRYKAAGEKKDNGEIRVIAEAADEYLSESLCDKFELENECVKYRKLESYKFDSNAITPGTDLMEYLHDGLRSMLMMKLSTDDRYKRLQIIYSSYLVPGEGEQKIMNFIRKYHLLNNSDKHVMYSPDGDIIFLGVGLYDVNLYIMREDTYNNRNKKILCNVCSKLGHFDEQCGKQETLLFSYIDVPEFRKILVKTFNFTIKSKYDYKRMLVDWVTICFLIGNDFLPSLPCVDIKIASIETLTNLLCKNYLSCRDYITTEDKMFNFHVLEKFFMSLSRLEDNLYITKTRMLNKCCEEGREEIPLHTKQGKSKYYATKMFANTSSDIDNIAIEYITGIIWMYNYYIVGRTDWQWVYPYHYAPFACDLLKVIRARFTLKKGSPLSPFEQLLVVIPPQSKELVSEKLRFVYTKYPQYYPTKVDSDMFDKYLSWTSVILLPHMNSKLVLADAEKVMNQIPASELTRTVKESDLLMVGDAYVQNFIGLYHALKPATKHVLEGIELNTFSYYKTIFPGEPIKSPNGDVVVNKSITVRFNLI